MPSAAFQVFGVSQGSVLGPIFITKHMLLHVDIIKGYKTIFHLLFYIQSRNIKRF